MASLPFLPSSSDGATKRRRREPLTGARRIIVVVTAGFVLFLLWATLAQVDEVTKGQGKVIPSSKIQLIQASEPATVRELLVRSGQRVHRGQLLARLDDTQSSSELGQIQAENQSLSERSARLQAEGTGARNSVGGNEALLSNARREALTSRVAALQSSAEQRRREVIDLQGRIAAAREQGGRANAAVSEALSQANEARFSFRQDALTERSQVDQKIAINEQSLRGARGKLNKSELRSPVEGVVNDVQVTTIGGFVQAGQKVMEVVPMGDKLLVETRVKPSDIAFIKVGDKALVKVTAYDFSTYGGLDGRVVQVSADSIYDEATREAYFNVIVETSKAYLVAQGRQLPITPGMMTDTQIITGRKSVLSYLLKPVLKARSDALRER